MKKRRHLTIGLAALALLGLLLIVAKRDRGPEVDGRPLEAWVRDLLITADPGRRAAARAAVGQLGTNAIPWLQLALNHTDSSWKKTLLNTADTLPGLDRHDLLRWVNPYERSEIRAGGAAGLAALGQAAAKATTQSWNSNRITALGQAWPWSNRSSIERGTTTPKRDFFG